MILCVLPWDHAVARTHCSRNTLWPAYAAAGMHSRNTQQTEYTVSKSVQIPFTVARRRQPKTAAVACGGFSLFFVQAYIRAILPGAILPWKPYHTVLYAVCQVSASAFHVMVTVSGQFSAHFSPQPEGA